MAINSDIRDQAYQFFVEEAPELLQTIESGLLTLRQEHDKTTVHSIMRAAHSIKGGSASVGLDTIKQIAHRLETIFKALYSESLVVDAEMESQLLAAYDCLRIPLTALLETGVLDAIAALETTESVLGPLEATCHDAIQETRDFVPTSSDLGFNMTTSIFEVDVAEGIQRLETVLSETPGEIAAELRAQAEVFIGFSELLNLPEFGDIARTAVAALDRHPARSIELATLAIASLKEGREAVLRGAAGGVALPMLEQLAADNTAFDAVASDDSPDSVLAEGLELDPLEPIDTFLLLNGDLPDGLDAEIADDEASAETITTVDVIAAVEAADGITDAADITIVADTVDTVDVNVTEVFGAGDASEATDSLVTTDDSDAFDSDAFDSVAAFDAEDCAASSAEQPSFNLQDQSYQFFVEEAPELLDDIESGLLTLRRDRNNNTIHSIMRAAHSLKGGSASVGLEAIKTISHRLEAIFKALYSDSLTIDAEMETQLLAAFDCLRLPLMEQLNTGSFDVQAAQAQANAVISPLEEHCHDAIQETEDFVPTSADLGIDMTASIFETDVAAGIARLEVVLSKTPEAIATELREQAEVFIGFAELLNLPGFAEIAQVALSALEAQPRNVMAIAAIAIENLKVGQAAVLAGDKAGGQPMPTLVQFTASADPGLSSDSPATLPTDDDLGGLEGLDLELWDGIASSTPDDLDALAFESGDRPLTELWPAAETDDILVEDGTVEEFAAYSPGDSTVEGVSADDNAANNTTGDIAADPVDSAYGLDNLFSAVVDLDMASDENAVTVANGLEASAPELPAAARNADPAVTAADQSAVVQDAVDTALDNPAVKPLDVEPLDPGHLEIGSSNTAQSEIEQLDPKQPETEPSETEPLDRAQPTSPAAAPPTSRLAATPPTAKAPVPTLTVRVDSERLARMNNLLGEITINRNGLDLQNT
ncbi:MAG: Hpt domain-containing protein, partial [Elainellaceae cyanobacterium]